MRDGKNKISFSSVLRQGLTVWLIGGVVFFLVEMVFVLIGLANNWEFSRLIRSLSFLEAISKVLINERCISVCHKSHITKFFCHPK